MFNSSLCDQNFTSIENYKHCFVFLQMSVTCIQHNYNLVREVYSEWLKQLTKSINVGKVDENINQTEIFFPDQDF